MSKGQAIASWVLVVVLAALYLMAGVGKLGGGAAQMFANWGYAPWFAIVIGVCEALGAVGLLIPRTTRLAVIGLTLIMLGAAYTHIANGEGMGVMRPVVFLVLLWITWWLRRPAHVAAPRQT